MSVFLSSTHCRKGRAILFLIWAILLAPALSFSSAVFAAQGDTAWADLREEIENARNNDTVSLTGDVTAGAADACLLIPEGISLTLDLAGHTLDRSLSAPVGRDEGHVLMIPETSILTVRDSGEGTGLITGGYSPDGGGILNRGSLILEGGRIAGNRAESKGGGIDNFGILVIAGGIVEDNGAGKRGGGVFNEQMGSFTTRSAFVRGNSSPRDSEIGNDGTVTVIDGRTERNAAVRSYLELLSVIPVVTLMLTLIFAIRIDGYLYRNQKRVMYAAALLVLALILENYLDYRLSLLRERTVFRTLISVIGYMIRPMILSLFFSVVQPGRNYKYAWILCGVNAAVYLTAFFSPLTFSFSVTNHFHSGPLNPTCTAISAVLFIHLILLTVRVFHPRGRMETWIPIFAVAIIAASVVLDYTVVYIDQPVSFLTTGIAISGMLYYIWLHLQFVREHEKDLRAEQRIQIMKTQIQPHFLYNTLMTIQALCRKDPEKAFDATGQFGLYLRQNLRALDQQDLIPLQKELEHTKTYARIEMLRFPNIRLKTDIEDDAFSLPPLTIQPLVENALRHGVRIREEGIVEIMTRRAQDYHEIVIRDNGTGFDQEKVLNEKNHIGIRNVRERLEKMCGGTLMIDSRIDVGTTVIIRIPQRI